MVYYLIFYSLVNSVYNVFTSVITYAFGGSLEFVSHIIVIGLGLCFTKLIYYIFCFADFGFTGILIINPFLQFIYFNLLHFLFCLRPIYLYTLKEKI